jgi:hypothetical protein
VSELLGEYVGTDGKAPAVVVPAWDVNAFALACVKEGAYAEGDLRDAIKNAEVGYNFAISRTYTIPADRVLGDGMVQVCLEWLRDVLALLMDFDNAPAPVSTSKRLYALLSAPEALVPNNRANQGGAACV